MGVFSFNDTLKNKNLTTDVKEKYDKNFSYM